MVRSCNLCSVFNLHGPSPTNIPLSILNLRFLFSFLSRSHQTMFGTLLSVGVTYIDIPIFLWLRLQPARGSSGEAEGAGLLSTRSQ